MIMDEPRMPDILFPNSNWSNPTSGLARLYEYLGSCKNYPVSLRSAACVSRISEIEICDILKGSSHYNVKQGEIFRC